MGNKTENVKSKNTLREYVCKRPLKSIEIRSKVAWPCLVCFDWNYEVWGGGSILHIQDNLNRYFTFSTEKGRFFEHTKCDSRLTPAWHKLSCNSFKLKELVVAHVTARVRNHMQRAHQ